MRYITRIALGLALSLVMLGPGLQAARAAGASPAVTVAVPGPPDQVRDAAGHVRLVPRQAVVDRLLVRFRQTTSPQQGGGFTRFPGARLARLLKCGVGIVQLPAGSDLPAALQELATDPTVEAVDYDYMVYPTLVPNDPEYSSQWYLPLMSAPTGWDITTGSSDIVVAHVDSGCDLDHPDLAANIYTNPGEIPNNGIDDDGNGLIDDVHGWDFVNSNNDANPEPITGGGNSQVSHGTLTAGLIAAVGNEGWGCAGVTWHCKILPIQVFPRDAGSPVSTVVAGMDYAVDMHNLDSRVRIMTLSLGGSYSTMWDPPIVRAHNAGMVVVAAAGNSGTQFTSATGTWFSPCCNDGSNVPGGDNWVIGVAATTSTDGKASFSNYDGSGYHLVDVSAPGVNIYGDSYYDPTISGFGSYFQTNSGTSFSCPMVSGLAALILSVHPEYTVAQVTQAIRDNADDISTALGSYAGKMGTGRINIAETLGVNAPPNAVTYLQAADTTGDEGGSITLTWIKSTDDGSGRNNVTEYLIFRREGSGGSWVQRDSVTPGTQLYNDSTTDGVDYYYQVRTVAGELSTDSAIVGPVQSRNDAAPPQVTDLAAVDHPADNGGAIDLTWTFTPTADYHETRVYRKTRGFSSISGLTPLVVLPYSGPTGSLQSGSYTDGTTVDGVDYYYAVTGVDDVGNENPLVDDAGPAQSYPNGDVPLAAGIYMLAAPAIPADLHPATLLGISTSDLTAARWSTAGGSYVHYTGEPLPSSLYLGLGKSLWVNLPHSVVIHPTGSSAPSGDFPVALTAGWTQLGDPFFGTFDFTASTVTYNGTTMDLATADAQNIVRSYGWGYDHATGDYTLLSPYGVGGRLVAPWQGFWVLAVKSCTLTLVRPTGTLSFGAQTSALPTGTWSVQLIASAGGKSDAQNWVGVRPGGGTLQIESPPPANDGVQLALTSDQSGAGPLAAWFVGKADASLKWALVVSWGKAPGEVSVTWPDLSEVPPQYAVTLRDLSAGGALSARHQSSYTFAAKEDNGERQLELDFTQRSSSALVVSALAAQPTGVGAAQLLFHLSEAASCDINILNIAGRPVRQLESGNLRPAGSNVALWDSRNSSGARVPGGLYLVRVTARTEDGAAASALTTLRVTR